MQVLEVRTLLTAPHPVDLSTLDGTTGFRLDGIDAFDRSGYSVSSAGDVNGDGFDDLIIGADDADPGGDSSAGESYVVFGKSGGFGSADVLADRTLLSTFFAGEGSLADPAVQPTIDMANIRPQQEANGPPSPLNSHRSTLPQLPGLTLVDPHTDVSGQIIFLDFDGAEDVIYNGPVTVGPFDVPKFEAPGELAGQEEAIIVSVVEQLDHTFAGSGVIFTTEQPAEGVEPVVIHANTRIGKESVQ